MSGITLEPEDESGYNPCQQLLVRSWRLTMARGMECPLIHHEFVCACGAGGKATFHSFCSFLWALALGRRRRLRINLPGCRTLTTDEIRMLTVIAASQHDCPALLQAHLSWLARPVLHETLQRSTHELASRLSSRRLRLPLPGPAIRHGIGT